MAQNAFPDLELISELGRGAETIVYRVRRGGTDYTLKLLTHVGGDAARALTTVRREAALLGCVGHPMLPRIFEVGQVEAGPYLVLEYIDGCPLSETLRAGRLDEAAIDPDFAVGDGNQTIDRVEERRLAAAARADDRHQLALVHVEIDVIQDRERLLGAFVVMLERDVPRAQLRSARRFHRAFSSAPTACRRSRRA